MGHQENQSNDTRNMKNVNFVHKDLQQILSSHKTSKNYNEQGGVLKKKLFLKISQENICVGVSFLIKMQAY